MMTLIAKIRNTPDGPEKSALQIELNRLARISNLEYPER